MKITSISSHPVSPSMSLVWNRRTIDFVSFFLLVLVLFFVCGGFVCDLEPFSTGAVDCGIFFVGRLVYEGLDFVVTTLFVVILGTAGFDGVSFF